MTKHKKYRILGVAFILLLVVSITIVIPTFAAKEDGEIKEEERKFECLELVDKYGLYIQRVGETKSFKLLRDTGAADACQGAKPSENKPAFKIISINGTPVAEGTYEEVAKGDNAEIDFTAEFIKNNETEKNEVKVMVDIKDDTKKSEEKLEYIRVEVIYSETDFDAVEGEIKKIKNPSYDKECKAVRDRVNNSIDPAEKDFFTDVVNYCFQSMIFPGTEYTAEEVNELIKGAESSWENFKSSGEIEETEWETGFDEIKDKALKKENHYFTNKSKEEIKKSRETDKLKCRYDFIKKYEETKTPEKKLEELSVKYTNDYGETIDSLKDYYLNKEYYYATSTTETSTAETGEDFDYVFNYAPGNTKYQENGATCKRTCEEAVKVEYGPPIASKAGVCFEYKVKITSYVKCSTELKIDPPKYPDDNYCNPAPKCKTISGVERKKPQAGPNEEFDACVSECDGGKYTPECSKKCYKEVYGEEENAQKLALSYANVKAEPLASSGYSLDECIKDNKDYRGCYYYDKETGNIRWKSKNYQNRCVGNKDNIGRWYIDSNYKFWEKDWGTGKHQYCSDPDGFYRYVESSGLCTDICNWKNNCGENQYLNPGTAIRDYKENLKVYERAKNNCEAKTTCHETTTELTISTNYDIPKDSDTRENIKVNFPYSEPEKIYSNPKGINEDKNFDEKSVLLDKDGCYLNSDKLNWYRSEWSFPGTYIHNKTGEITYKKPGDTTGWYYDKKKFCMPLNALSVNAKWWEWNVLSGGNFEKSRYTKAQIEDELNNPTPNTANGYNINATAKDFGLFEWNFDINCFYGLRNEVCDPKTDSDGKKYCETTVSDPPKSGLDHETRPIDKRAPFPNSPDPVIPEEGKEPSTPPLPEGQRPIGFNWTSGAINTKNPNYKVNPPQLIQHIDDTKETLYNDDTYLDYQIHLTPVTLRKIRQYNKQYDYGEWKGAITRQNGINVYQSNLWGGILAGSYKKEVQPGRNNKTLNK